MKKFAAFVCAIMMATIASVGSTAGAQPGDDGGGGDGGDAHTCICLVTEWAWLPCGTPAPGEPIPMCWVEICLWEECGMPA